VSKLQHLHPSSNERTGKLSGNIGEIGDIVWYDGRAAHDHRVLTVSPTTRPLGKSSRRAFFNVNKPAHRIYLFDEFSLDLTRGSLSRDSEEIKLRPKSYEVLQYLAENPGRLVAKDELISAVWRGTAVTDDSLVQCLKDVRRALRDDTQSIIKTVPRRGYVFEKEIREANEVAYAEETIGLRVVVEETFEKAEDGETAVGIERSLAGQQSSRSANAIAFLSRHRWAASVSGLTLVAAMVAASTIFKPVMAWYFKPPSIAVLPVVNATGNAALEYLSDGLTDSIIRSLAQLNAGGKSPRLRVIALNTVYLFKGKEMEPREVGQRLNVDTVLVSKMFEQDGLRIYKFELIDVADGSVRWTKPYAVTIGRPVELLEKQNEIPGDVAANLPISLSDADRQNLTRRYTQNPEAYDLYLKGRAASVLITPLGLRNSIDFFQRSIDLDPNFALPYWAMGVSFRTLGMIDERPDNEVNQKSTDLFQRALKIDDTLSVAIDGMRTNETLTSNWDAIKRAGPLHPGYGQYLEAAGRFDELIEDQKRRLAVNPYVPVLNWNHCSTLAFARRYADAITQCQRTLNLVPVPDRAHFGSESPWPHLILANIYIDQGKIDEAIAESRMSVKLAEGSAAMTAMLGYFYAKAGNREEALKILDSLNERMKNGEYVPPMNVAWIYGELGDRDTAFRYLNEALDEGETKLTTIRTSPPFDPLRSDPRFAEFMVRLNLPD